LTGINPIASHSPITADNPEDRSLGGQKPIILEQTSP
jgi:hypothetical protein